MLKDTRRGYLYDAWENALHPAEYDGSRLSLKLEPLKSIFFVLEQETGQEHSLPLQPAITEEIKNGQWKAEELKRGWKRSICRSIDYPNFTESKEIRLPDCLAEEEKLFSGFVRYENTFCWQEGTKAVLEITDAYEGVEVFVNGKSLGIQVVPVYRYDLSGAVCEGENKLVIEVATTLEREMSQIPDQFGVVTEPVVSSGINGMVYLYRKETGD